MSLSGPQSTDFFLEKLHRQTVFFQAAGKTTAVHTFFICWGCKMLKNGTGSVAVLEQHLCSFFNGFLCQLSWQESVDLLGSFWSLHLWEDFGDCGWRQVLPWIHHHYSQQQVLAISWNPAGTEEEGAELGKQTNYSNKNGWWPIMIKEQSWSWMKLTHMWADMQISLLYLLCVEECSCRSVSAASSKWTRQLQSFDWLHS